MGGLDMLTIKQILAIKPLEKDKMHNVERGGFYVNVTPRGGRYWYYRYTFEGVEAKYKLGTCTHPNSNQIVMSLASARKQFWFEKSRVANGIDIQVVRNQAREKKPERPFTVNDIYPQYKEIRQGKVVKSTWDKELGRMESYVLPIFGDTPLLDITTESVYTEMKKIALSTKIGRDNRVLGGHETAKRTARHFSSLMDIAVQFGKVPNNVVSAVAKLLPHNKNPKKAKALKTTELLGQYLYEVNTDSRGGDLIGIGCRLMPHLFVRHSEMLEMKWSEIDWDKKEWNRTISKQKKMEHRVFLSKQVIALLKEAQMQTRGREYVFYSSGSTLGHIRTLDNRLKALGWKQRDENNEPLERCIDIHGFRSTATSFGQDEGLGDHALIDLCVGHKTKAVHGESYDRATRFKERKIFMNEWSDYLEKLQKETAQESARKELRLV